MTCNKLEKVERVRVANVGSLLLAAVLCSGLAQAAEPPASSKTLPADNTGVNERDRSQQTLTPPSQSEAKSDIELAAAVRRAVVKEPNLSVSAQNIKIIVIGGRVTLRGPVKDQNERSTIERLAHQAAGAGPVENLLEVKQ